GRRSLQRLVHGGRSISPCRKPQLLDQPRGLPGARGWTIRKRAARLDLRTGSLPLRCSHLAQDPDSGEQGAATASGELQRAESSGAGKSSCRLEQRKLWTNPDPERRRKNVPGCSEAVVLSGLVEHRS